MYNREPFSEEATTIWVEVCRVSDQVAEDCGEEFAWKAGDWGLVRGVGMEGIVIRGRRSIVLAGVLVVGQESGREGQLAR